MKISRNPFTLHRLLWPCFGAIGLLLLTTLLLSPATAAEPFSCDNVTTMPQTECEALVSFYQSTGGYADYSWDWTQDDGWLTAADPCTWYGVGCSNGHVTILSLSNNDLAGYLPPELENLPMLQSLFASSNRIGGEIPAELGELTQLQSVYLQSNRLGGAIPAELGNLANLINLYLSRNQLSGEIPAELANLGMLNVSFSYNMLEASDADVLTWLATNSPAWANTQTVPPTNLQLLNVTNSTALLSWDPILYTANTGSYRIGVAFESGGEYLHWWEWGTDNKTTSSFLVTGLAPDTTYYFAIRTITYGHDEQQNLLESRFSEAIMVTTLPAVPCSQIVDIPQSECEALYALYDATQGRQWDNLGGDWKTSTAACTWENLACENGHVTILTLPGNNLKGTIPADIEKLTHLTDLSLNHNSLTGKLPASIGNLTQLTRLDVSRNQLNGAIPAEIGELHNLGYLNLSFNSLEGALPTEISMLENLQSLDLAYNDLTGPLPIDVDNLVQLRFLDLQHNELTGTIPAAIGNLSSLYNDGLWLNNNQLTGPIPSELAQLGLSELNLSHNELGGPLPPELFTEGQIYWIDFSYNEITGTIPNVFTNSHEIIWFDLSHNELTGPIPDTLPLSHVGWVRLNNNHLTGTIPSTFGTIPDYGYEELNFAHNELTGTLPASMAGLHEMRCLDLSYNHFNGRVDEVLSNIDEIDLCFDISHNEFSGPLPDGNAFAGISNDINFSHNHFTGTIPLSFGSVYSVNLAYNQLSGPIPSEYWFANTGYLDLSCNQFSGEIPTKLLDMAKWQEAEVKLDYNMLWSNDTALKNWLNTVNLGWQETQTVLPTNLLQSSTTYSSTQLHWLPISYTADVGYYEIGLSSAPAGPFTSIGQTGDKFGNGFTIGNLAAGTNYYIAIRTYTAAHDEQQNNLLTGWSTPLSFTTAVYPTPQMGYITPASIEVGSPTFTLTVIGTNFLPDSMVYWNNQILTTTYHSGTQLTALVETERLQTPQTVNIAVFTTGPGGGFSLSTPFTVAAPKYALYLPLIQ